MKVIYKPGIREQIDAVISLARATHKEIERIELTADEWKRFTCGLPVSPIYDVHSYLRTMYDNVRVQREGT